MAGCRQRCPALGTCDSPNSAIWLCLCLPRARASQVKPSSQRFCAQHMPEEEQGSQTKFERRPSINLGAEGGANGNADC